MSVVLPHMLLFCRWHAAGRQLHKPNSVSDLLACLQLLVQMHVTSPGRVAGHAASAGGLTLAAAVNAAPELFSAVVLEAPFVDWAGAMCSEAAQHVLSQHETDEWGDAEQQPLVAEMVAGLCPYSNLQPGNSYPAVLVTAGLLDSRVPFWMPVKFVAKLRSFQGSPAGASTEGVQQQQQQHAKRPILLQFDAEGGHFSSGQSGGAAEDIAVQYAFLTAMGQHAAAQLAMQSSST
jgi:oligopeptidase B